MAEEAIITVGIGGRRDQPAGPLPFDLAGIAALARTLEPPAPHELPDLMRQEAAYLVDGLLARLAHARGWVGGRQLGRGGQPLVHAVRRCGRRAGRPA